MEGGGGRRDFDRGEVVVSNKVVQRAVKGANFFEGGVFSFGGDSELCEVSKGWKKLAAAFFNEVIVEAEVVGVGGEVDDGRVGLVGLDDDRGGIEVAATDTADDLGEELEGFFFGGEVGKGEAGVGLDDGYRGEMGKVETTRNGLGADEDLDGAGFDFVVEGIERFAFFVVGVEACDASVGEKFDEFAFEELGAEAFVKDAGVVAVGAGSWDFLGEAAGMAEELVGVGVEGERKEAVGTEGLPAAFFTESEGGGAAAVVVDEGLVTVLKVFRDGGEKGVGEVAVFGEGFTRGEVDDFEVGGDGGGFGLGGERDEGVFGPGEVKV